MVEAPRGTLIHQYETDDNGIIRKANLIVATPDNSARCGAIDNALLHPDYIGSSS